MHLGPAITFDAPSAPSISPVEIADTPADRAQGLMGRSVLAPDGGMLFVFDAPTTTTFWMKDTTIPLTIAFIGPDRRIVNIQDMPPCKTTTCPTYAPKTAYTWAIEVNRGWFGDHEVKVGDRIVSPLP
jgi:uncharacterized membrane protein (UPF0127 family)